jgi:hypothetical protein
MRNCETAKFEIVYTEIGKQTEKMLFFFFEEEEEE